MPNFDTTQPFTERDPRALVSLPASDLRYPDPAYPNSPAAPAVLHIYADGFKQWVVPCCPRCGRKHFHGAGGYDDAAEKYLGHRVAHCLAEHGYVLVAADEPPVIERPKRRTQRAPRNR